MDLRLHITKCYFLLAGGGPADDTYVEMRPIKPAEDEEQYMHMNPVTLPHQTSVPSPPPSEWSALYPPPTGPAPIYAAVNQALPPPRMATPANESLHYAASDLLYSKRS